VSTLTTTRPAHRLHRLLIGLGAGGLLTTLAVAAIFGAGANPPCTTTPTTIGNQPVATGTFAAALQMQVGRWYQVGATQYGGPEDPTSGDFGSSGSFLPAHPDSFAELSVLDQNPANSGGVLSFQDADALGDLPYGTAVRVANGGRELTLVKRDIGYGQGPGQSIAYRMDVWWQAAARLNITKSAVQIQRLPGTGSGALLDQLPAGTQPADPTSPDRCAAPGTTPTPITNGPVAQVNAATGVASAPVGAPASVKAAIAAGDQLIDRPYVWGGGHADLNQLAPGYDCSGSAEYVLHHAGLFPEISGPDSTAMEHYYSAAGPGRWVTVYANPEHMWLTVAGLVLDTAWYSPVAPTTPTTGPRWQPATVIQQQIAGNAAAGNPAFTVTHPTGL
jgi:hypothetical protein